MSVAKADIHESRNTQFSKTGPSTAVRLTFAPVIMYSVISFESSGLASFRVIFQASHEFDIFCIIQKAGTS